MIAVDMPTDAYRRQAWERALLAGLLLGHFLFVTFRSLASGHPENLLWLSHAATLIGGLGILFGHRRMVCVALVCLLEGHLLWISDIVGKWITGTRWLGVTLYLDRADWADWVQSMNHFLAVPALLFTAITRTGVDRKAWVSAACLFAVLAAVSAFLPAESNINSAHRVWEGLDQTVVGHLNALPPALYVAAVVVLNVIGSFWPSNWLLYRLLRRFPATVEARG